MMDDDIQTGDYVIFNDDWAEKSRDVPHLYNIKKIIVESRSLRIVIGVHGDIVGLVEPHRIDNRLDRFMPYMIEKKYLTLIESP